MDQPIRGSGTYCDGATGVVHAVTVTLEDTALAVSSAEGTPLARFEYAALERLPAPEQRLRLAPTNSDARLDVRDPAFGDAVEGRLGVRDEQVEQRERLRRHRVMEWSIAAFAALALIGMTGIPVLTDLLIPFVPQSAEATIGALMDRGMREGFKGPGTFECGDSSEQERAGKAVFLKLFARIEAAAELPIKLHPFVTRQGPVNASAGPGGYFYVYSGIIGYASSPEELAGVIGHELGHVAHRDFLKQFLNAAGVSYLLVAVLSGGTGSGGVIATAQKLLVEHYSRSQEAAADAFSVLVMRRLGSNTHAIADLFERLMRDAKPSRDLLLLANHPSNADRIASIRAAPALPDPKPLLTADEWQALKQVCSGGKAGEGTKSSN